MPAVETTVATVAETGMRPALSVGQREARDEYRHFSREHVAPFAGEWDREGRMPEDVIDRMRDRGYLAASLPREVGGGGLDAVTYGLLTEEIARGCSSLRSLLTVHDMVTLTVARWGGPGVRADILPRLARGQALGALALSEPEVGSDAAAVTTRIRRDGHHLVVDGRKKWITFGQRADWFLVLGRGASGGALAVLVPATAPGFARQPIDHVVGTRASMLAELSFEECRVPADYMLGREGFGFSHVVSHALDHGRYSVAWGAVGIAQACLDACFEYVTRRQQFGGPLADRPLIQRKLTGMIAGARAARLLCYRAGYLRQERDPGAIGETLVAKYFASRVATGAANDAVQLHGANGLSREFPVERYLRDARVTEIIEGSSQILQMTIPKLPLADL